MGEQDVGGGVGAGVGIPLVGIVVGKLLGSLGLMDGRLEGITFVGTPEGVLDDGAFVGTLLLGAIVG